MFKHLWRPTLLGAFVLMSSMTAHGQTGTVPATDATTADPYLWLEDVGGDRPLAWVRERNAKTLAELQAVPGYEDRRTQALEILNNRDQIAGISRRGDFVYNFWRDAEHPRGLWRRTTLQDYRQAKPQWDVLLDLDALGKAEKENWVWASANCLHPRYERCLISVSRGGADAKVVREYDLATRSFVKGGFELPEAKSQVDWIDADTLFVGTDFGPGSMTLSGYPRVIKRLKRGTPLTAAVTVFEGQASDVAVNVIVDPTPGYERTVFVRAIDFYNTEQHLLMPDGGLKRIALPSDAKLSWLGRWALVTTISTYRVGDTTFPQGSLLAIPFATLMSGGPLKFDVLFTPTATRSLARGGVTRTRDAVLLSILDNVGGRVQEVRHVDGRWVTRDVNTPFPGTLGIAPLDDPFVTNDPLANRYLLSYTDFLTPASLYLGQVGSDQRERLKSNPEFFDAQGMRVEQRFARSRDDTSVPYFVVYPKGVKLDGSAPTLLYGYGGFQISMQPWYSGTFGKNWIGRGGIFVVANIRGGGEFGPAWHQAAVKANKQRSYDDFAAVAEDLVKSGITTARHLGIMGGSNGGLLVGAMMVQRPELFGAVVCQVPLLDMQRYHRLLAGNSWMAEYGDPDKAEEWAFISRYSPYQNVKKGVTYPKVLFATSTRDDRVHPGHARKMAARMIEQGHDVLYFENIEGGHGGAADNNQRATLNALEMSFLWSRLN